MGHTIETNAITFPSVDPEICPILFFTILFNTKPQTKSYSCIKESDGPLKNKFQITNIIYEAKITASFSNYNPKIYYGTSQGTFKLRYRNQDKSSSHEPHRKDTGLSNEYWRLKGLNASPEIEFKILKKYPPNCVYTQKIS